MMPGIPPVAALTARALAGAPAASGDDSAGTAEGVAFAVALAGAIAGSPPAPTPDAKAPTAEGAATEESTGNEGEVAAERQSADDALTACCAAAGALASRGFDAAAAALLAANSAAGTPGAAQPAGNPGRGPATLAVGPDPTARRNDEVTRANRDRAALDPELEARLARVEARMRAAGQPIQVTETGRSPARQDWLFAQGRSRPGPVVTWTRDSRHESGRAVDVTVLGPNDARGYALLQEYARAEGLATLGMRDPGHLELRDGATAPAVAGGAADRVAADGVTRLGAGISIEEASATNTPALRVAAVAPVTPPAQPAAVARVAQVAQVASVARPGIPGTSPESGEAIGGSRAGARRLLRLATSELAVAAGSDGSRAAGSDAGDMDGGPRAAAPVYALAGAVAAPEKAPRSARQRLLALVQRALARGGSEARGDDGATSPSGTGGTGLPGRDAFGASGAGAGLDDHGAGAARLAQTLAQVAQVRALRDAPVPMVSSLAVALDRGDGDVDRVRVGMAGHRLDASIASPDRGLTTLLRDGLPELATALERAGLSADRLDVVHRERVARAETRPASVAAAAVATAVPTPRDAASAGFGQADAQPDPRGGHHHGGGQEHDDHRHPARDHDADQRPAFASVLSDAGEPR